MNTGRIVASVCTGAAAALLGLACGCGGGAGNVHSDFIPGTPTYYGSCINADDIANVVVGWYVPNDNANMSIAYRLNAGRGGQVTAVRPFFIWSSSKAGYQGGTGGTIRVDLQSDDGTSSHFPSGTVLATTTYHPRVTSSVTSDHYPLVTFPTGAALAAGQRFHVVFTDVDADPKTNWVSLDCLWMWSDPEPNQPTVADADLAVLERGDGINGGKWQLWNRGSGTSITPIIEVDFADGTSVGQGYIQGYGAPDPAFTNPKPITGTQAVQECFTISDKDRAVTAVTVRVNRTAGSGPLTAQVVDDAGVVAQGTVQVPMGGPATATSNGASWNTVTFGSPVTLRAGTPYRLVLTSPSGTTHTAHVLAKGSVYGYSRSLCFGDGYAQFNDGSGWVGWDLWGLLNRLDTDLQFYFTVSP